MLAKYNIKININNKQRNELDISIIMTLPSIDYNPWIKYYNLDRNSTGIKNNSKVFQWRSQGWDRGTPPPETGKIVVEK